MTTGDAPEGDEASRNRAQCYRHVVNVSAACGRNGEVFCLRNHQ